MQKSDVRRRLCDDFAVKLEHEPQNSVRRWMRRPHVQHHFFADIIVGMTQFGVRRDHSRYRIGRLNFARRERHKIDNRYACERRWWRKRKSEWRLRPRIPSRREMNRVN